MIVGTIFISGLLDFSLNNSQKFILSKLLDFDGTASQFASSLGLPRSTVFSNLRILRRLNIVEFGNSSSIQINLIIKELLEPKELTMGVVGGFGSETTAEFFSRLIALSRERLNKRPKVVIANAAPPNQAETAAINGDVEKIFPFAAECIKKLNSANVDFIVIPCNTLHIFIDRFRAISEAPVLSIIEESVTELKQKKVSKVGLLATTATINSQMFQNKLKENGIKAIIPNERWQKEIVTVIDSILRTGKPAKKDSDKIKKIISNLKSRGVQAILLACTDLQLLVKADGKEIIDTMEVLANSAINSLKQPAVAHIPFSFSAERKCLVEPQKKERCDMQSQKIHNPAVAQLVERFAVDGKVACASQACGTLGSEKQSRTNSVSFNVK